MKSQISIFSYLLLSLTIFSFSLLLVFFWNSSINTFKKQFTQNFLEYFKETVETSAILGMSSCNFCNFEIVLRTKSFLPKIYNTIAIGSSGENVIYYFDEEMLYSNFYNLTKIFSINTFASLNKNLAINFSSFDKSISIFNID